MTKGCRYAIWVFDLEVQDLGLGFRIYVWGFGQPFILDDMS